jgi:lipopolysaccharide export system protein LptA
MSPGLPQKHPRLRLPGVLSGFCLLLASAAWSLTSDRHQEVEVNADGRSTIAIVEGVRVVTFRDNVIIRQGSMELRGDVAIIEYDQRNNEMRKVSVTGQPASFQQQPDGGGGLITGTSEAIYYLTGSENLIEFIGAARFTQDSSVMSCVEIRHNVESGVTEMTGPCSGILPPQSN